MNKKSEFVKVWLDKAYNACLPLLPPVRLDISLTTSCNANCAYCWHQEKAGSKLTFNNVSSVIDCLCPLKPPKLNLTGGEPVVWPDFERLLSYAKDSGIKDILLCTNGYCLKDLSYARKLIDLGVTAFNISVDTLDPDKFEMLRGFKFSEFQKTLDNCVLLKKKNPAISFTLASVMSKAVNPDELFRVNQYANKFNFGYFMQSFDPTTFAAVDNKFCLSDDEKKLFREKLFWLKGKVADVVKRDFNPLTNAGSAVKCYKGVTTVKLSSDGSVSFCWKSKAIGNILADPFPDIWTSKKAKEVREFIRDRKCACDFDCDVFESLELYDYV